MFVLLGLLALVVHEGMSEPDALHGYNMLTGNYLNKTWMEIGYASLTDSQWYTVTSTSKTLRLDRNYSVFISLPEYGGGTHFDGFPLVPKLKGSPTRNADNSISFQARLVLANDSACRKDWYVPVALKAPVAVSWMLVQNSVYNISGNMFLVDSKWMGRKNTKILPLDRPYLYHNIVVLNYTTGCNRNDPDEPCTFRTTNPRTVNSWACNTWFNCEKTWLHLGALQQIQTDVNKFNGKTMWLTMRVRNVFTNRIEMLMCPHSVGPDVGSYKGFYYTYETLKPELVSYFIYEQNVHLRCSDGGLHIETKIDYPITSLRRKVDFFFDYDYPPGLFGMVGSLTSGLDVVTLRVFNSTATGAFYITQEDQCYDEETEHTSNESAFTFVIGISSSGSAGLGVTKCKIIYNDISTPSGEPTGEPSRRPSGEPSGSPTNDPTGEPSRKPSGEPSGSPTTEPTGEPTLVPSNEPSGVPTNQPTGFPSVLPIPTSQPSSQPTSPTSSPSSDPSGEPSRVPVSEPSTVPSDEPTAQPTIVPSSAPSNNNTKSPSCEPSSEPTTTPTTTPPGNCTFQFLLVDMFGDGWVDVWANFTTTNMHPILFEEVQSELHQPNCSYTVVTMFSLTCSIEVSMMNGLTGGNGNVNGAVTPWENYWYIKFKGITYIGGINSFWKVVYGSVVEASHMVNHDEEDKATHCHECKHPPAKISKDLFGDDHNPHHLSPPRDDHKKHGNDDSPRAKAGPAGPAGGPRPGPAGRRLGKDDDTTPGDLHNRLEGTGNMKTPPAKPKSNPDKERPPPPYLVQIALYDEVGDGYYDHSGHFDALFSRSNRYALDLQSSFPNLLAYPKYYIMTKDRQRLIKPPGSICPARGIEYCEEALPYNGKFIFRFAGFEPWQTDALDGKDEALWRFCGLSGGINEEFEFEMRNGHCFPLTNTLSDDMFCTLGFESAIELAVTFNMTGAFGNVAMLTESDTALLEQEVAQLFPAATRVVVVAVEHTSLTSFKVEMKITVIAEDLGKQGNSDESVEALLQEVPTLCGNFLENDLLLSTMMKELDKSTASETDPLRLAEKISFLSVTLLNVHYQEPAAAERGPQLSQEGAYYSSGVEMITSGVTLTGEGTNGGGLTDTAAGENGGVVRVLFIVSVVVAVLVIMVAVTTTRDSFNSNPHVLLATKSEDERAFSTATPRKMVGGDFSRQQAATPSFYEDDVGVLLDRAQDTFTRNVSKDKQSLK